MSKTINLDNQELVSKYRELKSTIKVAKFFNCCVTTINEKLTKVGEIRKKNRRKYNPDERYFESINTAKKAYILGFMAADGCNTGNGLAITLHNKDYEILEFIKNEICKEVEIKNVERNRIRLDIYSRKLSNDLSNQNIIRNKTFTLKFPELKNELISHFIRGCFDGDGCISFCKHHKSEKLHPVFSYVSASKDFLIILEEMLRKECNLNPKKLSKNSKSETFNLVYEGVHQVKRIFDYLYKDSCFHLTRKFNKFNEYYNGNLRTAA